MTKPKSYDYVIYYNDQTYQTFNLTKPDVEEIGYAMLKQAVAKVSIGFVNTADIRSIVERIDPPAPTKPEIDQMNPQLSFEEQAYINELMGVRNGNH